MIHIHICIYIHVYIHACMHTYIHVYMRILFSAKTVKTFFHLSFPIFFANQIAKPYIQIFTLGKGLVSQKNRVTHSSTPFLEKVWDPKSPPL